jgi:hypothetical protein
MNHIYAAAHVLPVLFYGALVLINSTVRPDKESSIDSWKFALVMSLVAIVSGVLRVYGLDTWAPTWFLSFCLVAALTFVTLIGTVVGAGMLLSYTSNTPVNSTGGWLTEKREMAFLCFGGGVTLLVMIVDICVLAGLVPQPV